ncbi:hypothetical protein [Streptomyces sp. MMBL 11-1]|uniref:hypothetical protein n=1 Tax=Streptomyces sp. MMBL 11-1 TaxID=3026420 RepID=UPI00235FEB91|nr:hypothetical protein [Streptomyces sp. MMBL 11-1]
MSVNYKKLMEEEERAERERLEAEAAAPEPEAEEAPEAEAAELAIPSPGGEPDPVLPVVPEEPYRPQPFTQDLLPEPKEIEAEGDLTPEEVDELGHCEAAFGNANKAEWMKWKAAHAVRSRRLYRQDGRTWPDYCQDRFGDSESEVNRRIQQWPLLKAITDQQSLPRSIPDSHVQRLLPMVKQHGQDLTARAYVALRVWAAERRHRVTAEVVGELVGLAQAAEPPALTTANTFQLAIEPKPKPKRSSSGKTEHAPEAPAPEPAEPGGHPNLGDSAPGADSESAAEDEHQEPEPESAAAAPGADDQREASADPLTEQASRASDVLDGMRIGFTDGQLLRHARTDTLKAIMETALAIAEAAEDVLKDR